MPESKPERHERFLRAFTQHEAGGARLCAALVPSRADADDVLQEVAIVLWEKFDEFAAAATSRPGLAESLASRCCLGGATRAGIGSCWPTTSWS